MFSDLCGFEPMGHREHFWLVSYKIYSTNEAGRLYEAMVYSYFMQYIPCISIFGPYVRGNHNGSPGHWQQSP